jgi:hypothetical protein
MRAAAPLLLLALAACGSIAAPDPAPGPGSASGSDPGPAPANGAVATIGGCQVFPADNAWNRDVSADPVDPNSAALLSRMAPDRAIHLDLGVTEQEYGIPYVVVPASQPLVPITYGTDGADYSSESDPGPMPIPLDAPIEGGNAANPDPASGDRHVLVVQQGDCVLYELYNAVRTGGGYMVSSSARWDLKINATRPPTWTSADAAGLPILPGLLKYPEVHAGAITHALRFTLPQARRAYTAPASHCGPYADAGLPAYGTRVRLRADFDLSAYSGDAVVLLTALKRYGLIFADQGSGWYITGTTNPGWAEVLDQLRAHPVYGRDFEVVRLGPVTAC